MKVSPRIRNSSEKAFTLIELLVVISIIAILMGLLFPAMGMVREMARKTQAKNDEQQIVTAVKAYYTEYGKYPFDPGSTGAIKTYSGQNVGSYQNIDFDDKSAGLANNYLFDVLRNNVASQAPATSGTGTLVASLNPRGIVFMEVPAAKTVGGRPAGGVVSSGTGIVGMWYDPWGSPYRVRIDASYGNYIKNPYGDAPGGDPIATGVVSWALGRNGALGGGSAAAGGFTSEPGTQNNYNQSGDVDSWQ